MPEAPFKLLDKVFVDGNGLHAHCVVTGIAVPGSPRANLKHIMVRPDGLMHDYWVELKNCHLIVEG